MTLMLIFPKLNDAKTIIREKCEQMSGSNDTYRDLSLATSNFRLCLNELLDYDIIRKEIDDAPIGELDTVFNT